MLDLGWPELLVIAIVLIVVVGPKDLPRMLRTFGRTTSKLRSMAGDFRKQFDEALKEAELDDVKNLASSARNLDPRNELKKHLSPLEKAGKDVRAGLDEVMKPKPSAATGSAPDPASDKARPAAPAKAGAANTPGETSAGPEPAAKTGGAEPKPAAPKKAAATKPAARKSPAASGTAAASGAKTTRRAGGSGRKTGTKT